MREPFSPGSQEPLECTGPKIVPTLVKTFDFNRDGLPRPPRRVGRRRGPRPLSVSLGLPGGGYGPPNVVDFGEDDLMDDFDIGDVSGDGLADVVLARGYDFNTVAVVLGHGDGTFGAPLSLPIDAASGAVSGRIGDFNNDGHPDFISENSNEPTVAVFLGDGKGALLAPILSSFSTNGGLGTIDAADLNRDGVLDIVTATGYALGRGDGSFLTQRFLPGGPLFTSTTIGDFNSDGIPDIVGAYRSVVLFMGKGDRTFVRDGVELNAQLHRRVWFVVRGAPLLAPAPPLAVASMPPQRCARPIRTSCDTVPSGLTHLCAIGRRRPGTRERC